jgi:hypothetical protein
MPADTPLSSHRKLKRGSDRNFGVSFAAVFAIVSLIPLLNGHAVRLWTLLVSVVFLVSALLAPYLLSPLNRFWYRVELLLNSIINPLLMGFIFYGAVVPIGLALRVLGKDLLQLKHQRRLRLDHARLTSSAKYVKAVLEYT